MAADGSARTLLCQLVSVVAKVSYGVIVDFLNKICKTVERNEDIQRQYRKKFWDLTNWIVWSLEL